MAFINADWRDFQNTPAIEEKYKDGILIDDYLDILKKRDGIIRILSRPPCHPSASRLELFLQCRKEAYWALSAGM